MAFPRYDSYKDSGVEWLGEIPSHWNLLRNKFLFQEKKETVGKKSGDFILLSLTLRGVIARDMENPQGKFPAEFNTYKVVNPSNLIFCHFDIEETPRTVGYASQKGMITGAYTVVECEKNINSRYLYYYYLSLDFDKRLQPLYTGLRKVIKSDVFLGIKSPVPPLEDQNRIIEFLDRTTTEIDQAIAKKQRLIELLQEQKAILINQAVTKGLNPNVPMRDSGIEWIGKIPEHWEIKKLKYISKIKYGLGQPPREKENGLPLIRATNVERGKIVEKDLVRVDPDDIPYQRDPVLKTGDIVVVRSGAYTADSAIVTEKYSGSIAGYDMVLTAKRDVNPEYLAFCLLAKYVLYDQLYLLRMRAAQPHLNAEELGETLIIIPPFDEQAKIILLLQKLNQDQEVTFAITNREINLLNELKKLVIANAVTGKLKVCDRTF